MKRNTHRISPEKIVLVNSLAPFMIHDWFVNFNIGEKGLKNTFIFLETPESLRLVAKPALEEALGFSDGIEKDSGFAVAYSDEHERAIVRFEGPFTAETAMRLGQLAALNDVAAESLTRALKS